MSHPPAPPNRLNDLTGREWLPATRSAFIDGVESPYRRLTWDHILGGEEQGSCAVLSQPAARSSTKKAHPATFPESDARRLVRLFTRRGQAVLDPFAGSGSTAVACIDEHRAFIGFELYEKWGEVARDRIRGDGDGSDRLSAVIHIQDALAGMSQMPDNAVDFILTSPPYWSILQKKDHKAKAERNGLDTEYGDDPADLGNVREYPVFLDALTCHFRAWHRVLRARGYAAVVVSDFRHAQRYYAFHAHVGERLEQAGFVQQGLIVLVQDNKRLYPYGFPSTYVPNICNQFVVVARKIS